MKTRQYTIIIFFFLITIGLSTYSFTGNFDSLDVNAEDPNAAVKKSGGEESYFKTVDYYILDERKPLLQLQSTELTISNLNSIVVAFNPNGIIYRRNDKGIEEDPIYFVSKNSHVSVEQKEMILHDEVEITIGNSNLKSDKVTVFNSGKHLEANGSVRTQSLDPKNNDQILVNSEFALYRPEEEFFEYQKNVIGQIKRKRLYEENVDFKTDFLTIAGPQGLMEMKGNVTLKKGHLEASSNQGAVFLENYNKKLKYYSLSDDVRLQESLILDGRKVVRKAFSEKLEGFISEKKVILTGLPKVFQEKDVIKGNRIIIRENIETVEVDDANTNITLEREKEENI